MFSSGYPVVSQADTKLTIQKEVNMWGGGKINQVKEDWRGMKCSTYTMMVTGAQWQNKYRSEEQVA